MANVLMTKYIKNPRKVKPRKVKPRIKKKKVLTAKQRSRAAKKGWKNRKKREREFLKNARLDKVKKGPSAFQFADLVVHELLDKPMILNAVRALDKDDQEAALNEILKIYAKNAELVEVEEDPEQIAIRTRLRIADSEGNLEAIMEQIQVEYGMTPQEVYTEWLYSGVQ